MFYYVERYLGKTLNETVTETEGWSLIGVIPDADEALCCALEAPYDYDISKWVAQHEVRDSDGFLEPTRREYMLMPLYANPDNMLWKQNRSTYTYITLEFFIIVISALFALATTHIVARTVVQYRDMVKGNLKQTPMATSTIANNEIAKPVTRLYRRVRTHTLDGIF